MYRKKTQIDLDDLKRFIRIEEKNLIRSNLKLVNRQISAANAVTISKKYPRIQSNLTKDEPNHVTVKQTIAKFQGKCHNCDK